MNENFNDDIAYIAICGASASKTKDPHQARQIFDGVMEAYKRLDECDRTDSICTLVCMIENHVLELERDMALASLKSLQGVVQQLQMRFAAERETHKGDYDSLQNKIMDEESKVIALLLESAEFNPFCSIDHWIKHGPCAALLNKRKIT